MNPLRYIFRPRDKPQNSTILTNGGWSLFSPTSSGVMVNERTAMQISAVYACVRVLAEAVAVLPLHVYRKTQDGRERDYNHTLFALLHDAPNPEMTSFVWRELMLTHLLLYGNSFSQIIRNGRGEVTAIYPLLPDRMTVERDDSGKLRYIYQTEKGTVTLTRERVLHIPGLGFDGLIGFSPIALARNALGLAAATEDFGAKFFANGANPSGILVHPGVIKNRDSLRESWQTQFSGANAHRIAVLEEGLAYQQISIPPNDAQFLESRKFQIEEIARIFRVPLHMVGDLEHATFSNIEHLSLEFVKFSLEPWVVRIEQSMQQALLLPSERGEITIKLNMDGLLRGDFKTRMEGYAIARQNGWLSANDIRELEELNRIPAEEGGDAYLLNGNMVSLLYASRRETTTNEAPAQSASDSDTTSEGGDANSTLPEKTNHYRIGR